MRVKISYSVELEDVPKQVSKLLLDTRQNLSHISSLLDDALEDLSTDKEILKIVENLNSLRQDLFGVDSVFSDASDILVGYENTLLNKQDQIFSSVEGSKEEEEEE